MPVGWATVIIVQWVVIIALTVVVLGILRQVAPHLEDISVVPTNGPVPGQMVTMGLGRGDPLPEFTARDNGGNSITAATLLGHPSVLLFLSGGCEPCLGLAREIRESDVGELASSLIIVTDPDSPGSLHLPSWARIVIMSNPEARSAFGFPGWPFAMAVDENGTVTETSMLNTLGQVANLAASASPDPRLKVSAPATD